MTAAKNILVLCSRNSARSQMAEAFLRKHGGEQFNVFNAGIDPSEIHPLAIQVLEEVKVPRLATARRERESTWASSR